MANPRGLLGNVVRDLGMPPERRRPADDPADGQSRGDASPAKARDPRRRRPPITEKGKGRNLKIPDSVFRRLTLEAPEATDRQLEARDEDPRPGAADRHPDRRRRREGPCPGIVACPASPSVPTRSAFRACEGRGPLYAPLAPCSAARFRSIGATAAGSREGQLRPPPGRQPVANVLRVFSTPLLSIPHFVKVLVTSTGKAYPRKRAR